jgi:hypothetical protein
MNLGCVKSGDVGLQWRCINRQTTSSGVIGPFFLVTLGLSAD